MGLFSGWWRKQDVEAAVGSVFDARLRETVTALKSVDELTAEKRTLQESLDQMRRDKDALAEEIEREREVLGREKLDVQHKLGLEKMRQAQEAEMAKVEISAERERIKVETDLAVKEARLTARDAATAEAREQMSKFLDRQERMIETLLGSLPSAKLFQRTGTPDVDISI